MFYTYAHTRKDTGQVFYIGKGTKRRAWSKQDRNNYWKNIVAKYCGFEVLMIAKNMDEELSLLCEIETIDLYKRRGVRLCNLTDGGDNPPVHFGNKFNLGRSGNKHPMWGKKRPDNIARNKKVVFTGSANGRYISAIEATCITTNKKTIFQGAKELKFAGFISSAVYNCINPLKTSNKSHKGYTFKRLEK